MPDPTPTPEADEIVWEEPPTSRTRNPIVLRFRAALEAHPGQSARVQTIEITGANADSLATNAELAEKEASATAQAFSRLDGFTASYKKVVEAGKPNGEYRVWAQYDPPTATPTPGDE